jgi:hypothetical protein
MLLVVFMLVTEGAEMYPGKTRIKRAAVAWLKTGVWKLEGIRRGIYK